MKTKETPTKEGDAKQPPQKATTKLKTDSPLSEKDDFKKAEEQTRKSTPKKS
jgi:hypothetical protein